MIEVLFARNPVELTDEELDQIITYMRNKRAKKDSLIIDELEL